MASTCDAAWIRPAWSGDLMHASCHAWVGSVVAAHGLADRATLEVGSGIVNGTVRSHFTGPYVGVDLSPGNGVDRVEDCEHLTDPDDSWDVVVSTEMLEHCLRPWRAVAEMARICKPGGHVIVTARGFDDRGCWEPHGHPVDAFRYSELAMRTLAEDAGLTVREVTADPEGPGWFLHAVK